jgi:hypothetical protein
MIFLSQVCSLDFSRNESVIIEFVAPHATLRYIGNDDTLAFYRFQQEIFILQLFFTL